MPFLGAIFFVVSADIFHLEFDPKLRAIYINVDTIFFSIIFDRVSPELYTLEGLVTATELN